MRENRNPSMCLLDQILLDKLESDKKIEQFVYEELKTLVNMNDDLLNLAKFNSANRIISINNQIIEVYNRYE